MLQYISIQPVEAYWYRYSVVHRVDLRQSGFGQTQDQDTGSPRGDPVGEVPVVRVHERCPGVPSDTGDLGGRCVRDETLLPTSQKVRPRYDCSESLLG